MQSIAQGDRHSAVAMCTGTADRVALTKVVRPAMFSRLPFHTGMHAAIASMSPTQIATWEGFNTARKDVLDSVDVVVVAVEWSRDALV